MAAFLSLSTVSLHLGGSLVLVETVHLRTQQFPAGSFGCPSCITNMPVSNGIGFMVFMVLRVFFHTSALVLKKPKVHMVILEADE